MFTFIKKHNVYILLGLAIAIYALVFSRLSIMRLWSFGSYYYDLGIMNQVVSNTARGLFLVMTNQDFGINMSRFAIHFDAILAFFAPLYLLYHGPELLLVVQSIAISLAAIPLFLIGKEILKNQWVALAVSIVYLIYFPLEQANLFDYHSVTFLPLFMFSIFYFMWRKNYFWMLLFIFLSLLLKEEVGLTVFLFGLYIIYFQKNVRTGLLVSAIGAGMFIFLTFGVIPFFREGDHFALKYFDDNPWTLFKRIFFKGSTYMYIFQLFLPVAFISFFAPLFLLFAGPELLINLSSSNANLRVLYYHYSSGIVPFIFIALVFGITNLQVLLHKYSPTIKKHFTKSQVPYLIVGLIFIFSLCAYFKYSFIYKTHYSINANKLDTVRMWQQKLSNPNIIVGSTPQLGPFFTQRTYYYDLLPDPAYQNMGLAESDIIRYIYQYEKADYIVVAESEVNDSKTLGFRAYQALLKSGKFEKVFDENGIEVYKKYSSSKI